MVRQEIDAMVRGLRAAGVSVRVKGTTLVIGSKKLGENFLDEGAAGKGAEPTSCARQPNAPKSAGTE